METRKLEVIVTQGADYYLVEVFKPISGTAGAPIGSVRQSTTELSPTDAAAGVASGAGEIVADWIGGHLPLSVPTVNVPKMI